MIRGAARRYRVHTCCSRVRRPHLTDRGASRPTVTNVVQLSVIIPCYNVGNHVQQTLRSLRRNAASGFEFLLVDDASTDATAEILADRVHSVPGAQVITQPQNSGLSAARNAGLREATGEYITFLDGDDFYAAGYLPVLVQTIARLGCAMVRTDHIRLHGRRRTVHRINHGPRDMVMRPRDAILPVERPTSVDAPNAWAGIYHRSLADAGLLDFAEDLRTCEDRPWNWRLHLAAPSFAVVGLLGVFYRRDVATSLTRLVDERQFDFLTAHEHIVTLVTGDPDADLLLPKAVRSYCAIICHHLGRLDRYPAPLAAQLRQLSAQALHRLPADVLAGVTSTMDTRRRTMLAELMAA